MVVVEINLDTVDDNDILGSVVGKGEAEAPKPGRQNLP